MHPGGGGGAEDEGVIGEGDGENLLRGGFGADLDEHFANFMADFDAGELFLNS